MTTSSGPIGLVVVGATSAVVATILAAIKVCMAINANAAMELREERDRHMASEADCRAGLAESVAQLATAKEHSGRLEAEVVITAAELTGARSQRDGVASQLKVTERDLESARETVRRQNDEIVATNLKLSKRDRALASARSEIDRLKAGLAIAISERDKARDSAAIAQWDATVSSAVAGECGGVGGFLIPGAFSKCELEITSMLSDHRADGIRCMTEGGSAPLYRKNTEAGGGEFRVPLRRGQVVLCDRELPEAGG